MQRDVGWGEITPSPEPCSSGSSAVQSTCKVYVEVVFFVVGCRNASHPGRAQPPSSGKDRQVCARHDTGARDLE